MPFFKSFVGKVAIPQIVLFSVFFVSCFCSVLNNPRVLYAGGAVLGISLVFSFVVYLNQMNLVGLIDRAASRALGRSQNPGSSQGQKPVDPLNQKDDPELYILDRQIDVAMWIAEAMLDATPVWEICPITEGYEKLVNFFRARNMDSLIISRNQFMQEWFDGIEKTQMGYVLEEGTRREFVQYGCPISQFTGIVDAIRITARREVPSAVCSIENWRGDRYRVGVSRGLVTFLIRDYKPVLACENDDLRMP